MWWGKNGGEKYNIFYNEKQIKGTIMMRKQNLYHTEKDSTK
jgi:hypothetical protein